MKKRKLLLVIGGALIATAIVGTYAAFTDKAKILGATFSVSSADLRLLDDLAGGIASDNLVDEKEGPSYDEVSSYWEEDYLVKLYNNAPTDVQLTTNAYYVTANDPDDLRQEIYVEPFDWDDANSDGVVDSGEMSSTSYGKKTIVKWKTEGFDLGTASTGSVRGLVLRFSTDALPVSKQGASALFDFEFEAEGM